MLLRTTIRRKRHMQIKRVTESGSDFSNFFLSIIPFIRQVTLRVHSVNLSRFPKLRKPGISYRIYAKTAVILPSFNEIVPVNIALAFPTFACQTAWSPLTATSSPPSALKPSGPPVLNRLPERL
jgi:hypothetical protein